MNIEDKLKATVLATALQEEETRQKPDYNIAFAWISGAGVALASLALILALSFRTKDTFDDPSVAYAQVQETFTLISQKIEKGLDMAQKAEEPIDKINTIFE